MESIKRIEIIDLFKETIKDSIGKEICVKGWVRTKRGNKHVAFIALNDGSTIKNIQVVADVEKFSEDLLKRITTGACLRVNGLLVEWGKDKA